jgi:hypothetical protein
LFTWRWITVEDTPQNDNLTHYGPPGTGKTWTAHRNHRNGTRPLDIQACFSNAGVTRLRNDLPEVEAMTMHRLFKIKFYGRGHRVRIQPDVKRLEELRGKSILVDEAQANDIRFFTLFAIATYEYGIRFTFCMDVDQVLAVDARLRWNRVRQDDMVATIPMDSALLGRKIRMSQNHLSRNDAELARARRLVLDGKLTTTPSAKPTMDVLPNGVHAWTGTKMNLCAKRKTKHRINAYIVEQMGLSPGDPGRYVSRASRKGRNKGDIYDYDPGTQLMHPVYFRGDPIYVSRENLQKSMVDKAPERRDNWDWGYCHTTHSVVGSTFDERITVWEWDDENNVPDYIRLKYTAMTRVKHMWQLAFIHEEVTWNGVRRVGERRAPPRAWFSFPPAKRARVSPPEQ